MNLYDFSHIYKSCGFRTQNKIVYCYECNKSNKLTQCTNKSINNVQCKLKSIQGQCIFYKQLTTLLAQKLIDLQKVPLKNETNYEFENEM